MLHYFIFALDCAFFRLFYSIRGFSEPLKKEQNKKSAAPYMFDWVNTSLKRLKRFEDEAKVEQIIAIVTTHSVSFYSSCFVLAISLLNLILLQYDVMCAIHLLLLFIGKAPHESTKYSIYITTESVLVRYDGYLAKALELFLLLQHIFFISNT